MLRLLLLTMGICLATPSLGAQLLVATASNFKPTLIRLAASFQLESGHEVVITSAATGVLYNQIIHGAPFQVLLAADAELPTSLEQDGYTLADSRFTYAYGKLVLAYQPQLQALASEGVSALLQHPELQLVIANPEHAPYGRAAMAVLARFPQPRERRLIRASNVAQAFQMWFSGGVELALLAKSYAPANVLTIPASWHPPLEQQAVLLRAASGNVAAQDFMAYLQSAPGRELIRLGGYATELLTDD